MKNRPKSYSDTLLRAKATRSFIAKNPGLTFFEIKKRLHPMVPPISWLFRKNYVYKKGGVSEVGGVVSNTPVVYFVRVIGGPMEMVD